VRPRLLNRASLFSHYRGHCRLRGHWSSRPFFHPQSQFPFLDPDNLLGFQLSLNILFKHLMSPKSLIRSSDLQVETLVWLILKAYLLKLRTQSIQDLLLGLGFVSLGLLGNGPEKVSASLESGLHCVFVTAKSFMHEVVLPLVHLRFIALHLLIPVQLVNRGFWPLRSFFVRLCFGFNPCHV
jgi:hypothetical protein